MFNTNFWFHNNQFDTAVHIYPPDGIPPEPPEINFSLLDPCGIGTLFGDISVEACGIYTGSITANDFYARRDVRIGRYIYDSVNSPGLNGYFLARDERGIRWLPPLEENSGNCGFEAALGITGIASECGFYVLDEGVPLPKVTLPPL